MAQPGNRESGIVLVLFAILLPVLIAMMGLIIDLGHAQYRKRVMQTAADAAAFAGAHTLKRKDFTNVNSNCLYDAGKNGFDGSGGETITINRPPLSGDFTGDTDFVEVIITEDAPARFMSFFGTGAVEVSARGVGGVIPSPGCIYVLDGNADKAFDISSGSDVMAPTCGTKVSSCSDTALNVTSGSGLDSSAIEVCGGVEDGGGTVSPAPNTGVCPGGPCSRGEDPLADLPQPAVPGGCDHTDFLTSSLGTPGSRYQIWPGTYCGGISIESGSHVNFNPGTYYLKGKGLQIQSGSTAEGFGVGFFNTDGAGYGYDPINIQSGSEVRFSAQAGDGAGAMEGVLFWQDRTISGDYDNKIESDANSWFEGTLYFPTQHLMFHSNTVGDSAASWSILITNTLEVSSNTVVGIGSNFAGTRSPILEPTLVE